MRTQGWSCVVLAVLAGVIAVLVVVVASMVAVFYGTRVKPATALVSLKSLASLDEFRAVRGTGPGVVLFHTPWCKYCVKMLPHFEQASTQGVLSSTGARFAHMDAQDHSALIEELGIPGFPTLVLFNKKDGSVVSTRPGYATVQQMHSWLLENM